jgi:heparan-alpha-glucosaminide N-acetyltransferase
MPDVVSVSPTTPRLGSMDAYRGFVMLLMLAEVLDLQAVSRALPESSVWRFLAGQQSHSAWAGCTLHDLIQPSFSFLVGVALPFSLASRAALGQPQWKMTAHAWWRALLLVLLGIFLRSVGAERTVWTFEDTLTQIGLGYPLLYWLGARPPRVVAVALGLILVGYWALWVFYPLPPQEVASAHGLAGFFAHWNGVVNPAVAFDRWFLNGFPRSEAFVGNPGGYVTLSFIPTLGTMLLGLMAGRWLKADFSPAARIRKLVMAGIGFLSGGLVLHMIGFCPIVKPVWTPAWTLFSGGACFLLMASFYAVIDVRGWRRWAFPLVVIGMNSIAAYVMAHLMGDFIRESFRTHLGAGLFALSGVAYAPVFNGLAILAIYWLILLWLYRRRIFLKI